MSLEKTLAEIEVLAEEIYVGNSVNWSKLEHRTYDKFEDAIRTLKENPAMILDKYKKAKKAISKKDTSQASTNIAEFALDIKNLADSLNIFLQTFYGSQTPSPKNIKRNVVNSPRVKDGRTLLEVFLQTHDYSKDNTLNLVRNMKGHGKEHSVIICAGSTLISRLDETPLSMFPTGYRLRFEDDKENVIYGEDPVKWMDKQIENYFEMTRTILETVIKNRRLNPIFVKNKATKSFFVAAQRIKNWMKAYRTPVQIALAAALISTGVLGTLGYQKISEKDREIYEANQIRNLIQTSYLQSTENWARDLGRKSFNQTLDNIRKRTVGLGETLESYVDRLQAISNGKMKESLKVEVETFKARKCHFYIQLDKLNYDSGQRNAEGCLKCLADISGLLTEERLIMNKEKELLGLLEYGKIPYAATHR